MCGICGIVCLDREGRVDFELVDRMTNAMIHRGPDGSGTWFSQDATVGLGHRRLSIIDLSPKGKQPMSNEDGSIWVTFNGEIYNYRRLKHKLELKGHIFRSHTDTEVLVHLYEEKQEKLLDDLEGDYGFVIWDDKAKQLFVARDRAGVKPVYYAMVGNYFIFASEIKAILASGLITRRIDEKALYNYLTYLVSPPPATLLQDVKKLAPGSAMVLSQIRGRLHKWCYWEPLPGQSELGSDLDEQLSGLFQESVHKRMEADVPIGTLFSGGVDSTLNTVFFQREISPARVRTYNIGMKGTPPSSDESGFALEMSRFLGGEHYQVKIGEEDVLAAIDTLVKFQDEPLADPVCVPQYFVTKLARETGTTVLHAGEGADEIFCGYKNYLELMRYYQTRWQPLCFFPHALHKLAYWMVSLPLGKSFLSGENADLLRRHSLGQEYFMSSAIAFYEGEKGKVLSSSFRSKMQKEDSFDVVRPLYTRFRQKVENPSFLQLLTFIELNLRLPELLLMRTDKTGMANSVEIRVPFLDHKLIEFALSVPESFKIRNGVPKEPLKRMAAKYVPKDLIYRPKVGFWAPIREWFGGKLGEAFREMLCKKNDNVDVYFNRTALLRMLTQEKITSQSAVQLWGVFNFLKWKGYVDGK